jgi:zinc protease
VPQPFLDALDQRLSELPSGEAAALPAFSGRRPQGTEIEIVEKETRATAISFGFPIDVTRAHADFAALWLVRSWLGEHRASQGQLFQRLRELRGLNYGDYAYVEAFPGAMYRMSPEPGVVRRAQLFEIWIRPVAPENAFFALKLAQQTLQSLIERGLSDEQFSTTRDFLIKNVLLTVRTQDQLLGYALDSRWYEAGDFVSEIRRRLAALTAEEVNAAVRRHLAGRSASVVIVTEGAAALREQILGGDSTPPVYDAPHPELREEDERIAALPFPVDAADVRVTNVEDVFSR